LNIEIVGDLLDPPFEALGTSFGEAMFRRGIDGLSDIFSGTSILLKVCY
jgi:hypothetical protein